MGCDINTSIGIAETKHDQEISGKFRIQQRRHDICENHMHNFMHANDLKSMTTCFQHKRYDTWTHPNPTLEVCHQLDHWLVQRRGIALVINVRRWNNRKDSDHAAVKLTL